MLSIRRPSMDVIRGFLQEQASLPFTYSAVGATAHTPPAGFVVDQTRVLLGHGEEVFRAAKSAIQNWQQFQLGWVEAGPRETPIRAGEAVAVMGHALGVWWLNACRIVYVVDETESVTRFGLAYGTLPGHVESGEERSRSSGIAPTRVSGTTSWHSLSPTTCWLGSATPWCGSCRSDLPPTPRGRCGPPWRNSEADRLAERPPEASGITPILIANRRQPSRCSALAHASGE